MEDSKDKKEIIKTPKNAVVPVFPFFKSSDKASPVRSLSFDPRKKQGFQIDKGLRKPGRVSFETLRRASYSVHVARICINVLKEKVSKTKWVIQSIDSKKRKNTDKRIEELTRFFRYPNENSETFRTLLDKVLEDLLVLDSVAIEKTRYNNGSLAEIFHVDAATVRPVMDEYGNQDIEIPIRSVKEDGNIIELPVSYVQVLNNTMYGGPESGDIVAAWPKKDMIYFSMHPQGSFELYGYGMSPLEAVLSVVSNILNADNYNSTYFDTGAFPPVILQLMGQVRQEDLERYREYLYSELSGEFHRPAIIAGEKKSEILNFKDLTNRDMEFMEYMKFMSRLMAAAYGLSAQDIGITDDLNRATSEVQKSLSEAKGYGSILNLLKEVFDSEIIWKDFGYEDLEFEWVAPDNIDPKEASTMYDTYLKSGVLTLNEVRQKLGENTYEPWADEPMVLTSNGFVPVVNSKPFDEEDSVIESDSKSLKVKEGKPIEKAFHKIKNIFKKNYETDELNIPLYGSSFLNLLNEKRQNNFRVRFQNVEEIKDLLKTNDSLKLERRGFERYSSAFNVASALQIAKDWASKNVFGVCGVITTNENGRTRYDVYISSV